MKISLRGITGNIALAFVLLPQWATADNTPDQQLVEQAGQVGAGSGQVMPAWVEPPVGPYRFFPPQPVEYMAQPMQPDREQAGMMPDPSADYPGYQRSPYPPAGYPPANRQPLPVPNNGYAYDYQYQYQSPGAGSYSYDGAMQPPARAYDYGGYPRGNYPADMRPGYYPYGSTEQMPVQPYYR